MGAAMPSSLEAVVCLALFVVPGYISLATANAIAPHYSSSAAQHVLNCLSYSLALSFILYDPYINALTQMGLFGADNTTVIESSQWRALIVNCFFWSALLGLAVGLLRRAGAMRKLAAIFHVNMSDSTSAWDFKFSRIDDARWLRITMNSGRQLFGLYSNGSNATSISDEAAGIFIEKVTDENWKYLEDTDGMYISERAIETIEFFKEGGKNEPINNQGQKE